MSDDMRSVEFIDRILLGSSERMDAIPDRVVHLTVTSPPYWNAIDYRSHVTTPNANYRHRRTGETYAQYLGFLERVFREVWRVHRPGTVVAVVVGTVLENGRHIPLPHHLTMLMESLGFVFFQDIIWHKCTAGVRRAGSVIQKPYPGYYYPNIMTEYILLYRKPGEPLYRGRSKDQKHKSRIEIDTLFTREIANNIWNIAPVPPGTVDHPCPFPEEIPERLIRLFSYVGDLVLDPFAGSGTTLKVAKLLGRHFVGYDTEPRYVELALRALAEQPRLREEQLVLVYDKVRRGERLPAKNARQRRNRKRRTTGIRPERTLF